MKRLVLVCIGIIATILAVIGVWTPGLPTTPFLIVALWAFAGSSQRLHFWLSSAPIFKSAMVHAEQFKQNKTIKKEIKLISQLCAWGSFFLILSVHGIQSMLTGIVLLAALSCSFTMYKIKTAQDV